MSDLNGAVIAFDLDGTLVDTAPDLIGALNQLLREEGLPEAPLQTSRGLIGRGVRSLVERGFAGAGRPLEDSEVEAMIERGIAVYSARITRESRPFDGVRQALDRLAAAGATLAVCTNKRTSLSLQLLDALGLSSRFAAIVGGDLAAPKPAPDLLWLAIERAGGQRERALFVGDSQIDLQTARGAGVPVIGVSFGYSEAPLVAGDFDGFIDSFEDLPPLAAAILGDKNRGEKA